MAGFSNERIRIRMEAFDHEVLDRTAHEIVDTAQRTGAVVNGPIPLPTRIERYTVLRSPHIDRKSREQFEIRTHKRLIDILKPTSKTIEDAVQLLKGSSSHWVNENNLVSGKFAWGRGYGAFSVRIERGRGGKIHHQSGRTS